MARIKILINKQVDEYELLQHKYDDLLSQYHDLHSNKVNVFTEAIDNSYDKGVSDATTACVIILIACTLIYFTLNEL